MTLVTPKLKGGVKDLFERLAAAKDPAASTGKTKAVVKAVGPQTCVAVTAGFSVASDEPEALDGRMTAPYPSFLFSASIGMAESTIFARQAALYDVDYDTYETTVEGLWDMKGMFGQDGHSPAFTSFNIETRVTTAAPPEKIAELLRLTHERCQMTATVSKGASIDRRLFVNGVEVKV
ncbi:MAG TPA: OsmC family protein [Nitrososphaerales archaeon]|nr:OsmC family protein [Nitrososphaerales archaeon]